jgi:uncharacterized protein YecT (DUF1311 family)
MALRPDRSAPAARRAWRPLAWLLLLVALASQAIGATDCDRTSSPLTAALCAEPDLRAAEASMQQALDALAQRLSPPAAARLRSHQKAWTETLARDCEEEFRAGQPRPLAACLLPIFKERTTTLVDWQQPLAGALRYPSLGATPQLSVEWLDGDSPVARRLNARVLETVPARLPEGEEGSYTLSALGPDVALLSGVRHRRIAGEEAVAFQYRYVDLGTGRWLRGADFFLPGRIPDLARVVHEGLREGVDAETLACYASVDAAWLARELESLERVELGRSSFDVDLDLPPDCRSLRGATVDLGRAWPFLGPRYLALLRKKSGLPP